MALHRAAPLALVAALAAFAGSAYAQPIEPSKLQCDVGDSVSAPASPLPDTHYLFNEDYGWFDTSHFNTGRPGQVLADVRAAAEVGGGIITIEQGLHGDVTGYTGRYFVSGTVPSDDVTAVALSIYLDWSVRFEAWEARPPQGLLGPTSSFAVEDLPSQYLGFVAAALDLPVAQIFNCYLGPAAGSEEGPPDLVPASQTAAADGWIGLARLDNRTFVPLAPSDNMWRFVNWPLALQFPTLTATPETWGFMSDETWFFGNWPVLGAAETYLGRISRGR